MVRFLLLLSLIFLFSELIAQDNSNTEALSVEGFVTNTDNRRLENVHIVNVTQQTGTSSKQGGLFRIAALPGDTLRFTSVGYSQEKYLVPSVRVSPVVPVHITMQPDTLLITGVTIYPWPADAQSFKQAILAMDDQSPKEPDLKLNDPRFYNTPIPGGQPKSHTPGMMDPGLTYTIPGPITALYEAYSKEGKSRRKLESLVNQDERKEIASRRYNAEVVHRVSNFSTDKEIQDFMLYCNLSVDFILNSSEYDLYKAIHDCLLAYAATDRSIEGAN